LCPLWSCIVNIHSLHIYVLMLKHIYKPCTRTNPPPRSPTVFYECASSLYVSPRTDCSAGQSSGMNTVFSDSPDIQSHTHNGEERVSHSVSPTPGEYNQNPMVVDRMLPTSSQDTETPQSKHLS